MPWLVNDILELKLHQTYLGQEVLNIIHYKITVSNVGADWPAGLDAIAEDIVEGMTPAQNDDLEHFQQQWNNLSDGITFHDVSFVKSGGNVAQANLNSFSAAGLKKVVETRITRPGSIRIAGLSEEQVAGNSLTAAAVIEFNSVGLELGLTRGFDDGTPPDEGKIVPVVVGRTLGVYDLSKINVITDYGLPVLTSQVTRKDARGGQTI